MALTLPQFVQAARDSCALPPEELAALEKQWAAQKPVPSAQDVAKELVRLNKLTRHQVKAIFEGKAKSLVYGAYVVIDKIGAGGMGEVFRARHTRMKRMVALKLLPAAVNRSPDVVKRFQREVEAAARLMHHNIVTAFDAGEAQGVSFIAMEFVDGRDLSSILAEKGPLPIAQAVDCITQAARGLEYAHGEGLVHRDIKPANLLLDKKGTVKILDMGLARFEELFTGAKAIGNEGLTTTGQIMGTVDYMSPEQAEDTRAADGRSDIYSLGCTLYRLLTGQTPFQAETLMQKLLAHRSSPVPSLRAKRPDAPAELDAVFAKMIAKQPADRYQSMTEVIAALQSCLSTPQVQPSAALAAAPDSENVLSFLTEDGSSSVLSGIGRNSGIGRSSGIGRRATASGVNRRAVASEINKRKASSSIIRKAKAAESTVKTTAEEDTHKGKHPKLLPLKSLGMPKSKRGVMIWGLGAAVVLLVGLIAGLWFSGGKPIDAATPQVAQGETPGGEAVSNGAAPDAPTPADPSATAQSPTANAGGKTATTPGTATPDAGATATTPAAAPHVINPATGSAKPADGNSDKPDLLTTDPSLPPLPNKEFDPNAPAMFAPTTPNKPAPATPTQPAPPTGPPQTLIVGADAAQGHYTDLNTALSKARRGDKILIRHRGPLELDPHNLLNKTPLTIEGDKQGDVDFWPIIKQSPANPPHLINNPPGAIFFAPQMMLTLRKVHLLVGGSSNVKVSSVFALGSGRVELDQCTVTAFLRGNFASPPGDPIALVQTLESEPGLVEVVLKNCLMRGQRLRSCVLASGVPMLSLQADNVTWAGGQSHWIAGSRVADLSVKLNNSTIYNVTSLLKWQVPDERQPSERPAVDVQLAHSLVVGPFSNKLPLVDWTPRKAGEDLPAAAAAGLARWQDDGNVYFRFAGYAQEVKTDKPLALARWTAMWNTPSAAPTRELDPCLRLNPDGYELQETSGRDLEPRWSKVRGLTGKEPQVGAKYADQAPALAAIWKRKAPALDDLVSQPRGVPRVLRVNQRTGPYKTLEAAFAELQDDDVVEISDNGPYTPVRNYTVSPATAVLASTVEHLTVRAADNVEPIIILRDDVQEGRNRTETLHLFSTSYAALSLDGLHIRFATTKGCVRTATKSEGRPGVFRFTNGSIIDTGEGQGYKSLEVSGTRYYCLAHSFRDGGGNPDIKWLENNLYHHSRKQVNRDFTTFLGGHAHAHGNYLVLRNNVFNGDVMVWDDSNPAALNFDRNTVLGHVAYLHSNVTNLIFKCTNNFVSSLGPPLLMDQAALGTATKVGGDNALWLAGKPPTEDERKLGVNAVLPGPVIKTAPVPAGAGTAKDPYARYRPRAGQSVAKMASDGGPAGARTEYLPMPALPPEFFQ